MVVDMNVLFGVDGLLAKCGIEGKERRRRKKPD